MRKQPMNQGLGMKIAFLSILVQSKKMVAAGGYRDAAGADRPLKRAVATR